MYAPTNVPVFGFVKKEMKERLKRIRRENHVLYSESRLIREGLEKIVPEIEKELGLFNEPTGTSPRRKTRAA